MTKVYVLVAEWRDWEWSHRELLKGYRTLSSALRAAKRVEKRVMGRDRLEDLNVEFNTGVFGGYSYTNDIFSGVAIEEVVVV